MTTIQPTTQPVYWIVAKGGVAEYDGVTPIGALTGVGAGYDAVTAEGENAFLGMVDAAEVTLDSLPAQGEWLEAGRIYAADGQAVMVRQSHTRTEHPVADLVPTQFLVYRADAGDVLAWIAGESVVKGTRRTYDGVTYSCVQGHATEYAPPDAPALWEEVVEAGDPWQSGTTYDLDAVVTHDGATWESRRANNVWEPGINDSGWLRTEPYPSAWYYLGGEGYPVDWDAQYDGYLWRNTVAGNHWEPGVYGWTQLEAL